ncbi:MAG: hypothetical protein JXR07_20195 [Reichenbachiella sp.]
MKKYALQIFLVLSSFSLFAQIQFFHADSAGIHLNLLDSTIQSLCVPLYDTSIIKMHTWMYYKPQSLISDSSYFENDRKIIVQKITSHNPIVIVDKLTYHDDTVYVENMWHDQIHSYHAIQLPKLQKNPYRANNIELFGWSINRDRSGYIHDSTFYLRNQPIIYKQFYSNGQLKHHQYFENGEPKYEQFKENGKTIKNNNGSHIIYMLDSVNLESYALDNTKTQTKVVRGDTSIIKLHTWAHLWGSNQIIFDSTYILNDRKIQVQRIYWPTPEKKRTYIFKYIGDTVQQIYFSKFGISTSQLVKTNDGSNEELWNYGHTTDYQDFGWSVIHHKDGYILDSTSYDKGVFQCTKRFYPTGEIKTHILPKDSVKLTIVEYKKSGKIRQKTESFSPVQFNKKGNVKHQMLLFYPILY